MDPQRWAKIESLYHAVLEKKPRERSRHLVRACAGDSGLRHEVETLLGCADAELKSPMADPVLSDLRQKDPELYDQVQRLLPAREDTRRIAIHSSADSHLRHVPGVNELIGPYRLLSVLGEGGMGIVYLAEQERPIQRRVALKLIRPGIAFAAAVARFESERQALAMMEHPNIAHVYDAGATEAGQPYFVMEYVPGPSITAYCDQHRLTNRDRLKLFSSVCLAVHHAHQKGVIHRDLKPSNVLVKEQDGTPVPKVIDFGIAKAIDQIKAGETLFTLHGVLAGTPEYMSPEQANLDTRDVDASSDVYSLGVLLYELLVGTLPFDPEELRKKGLVEILRIIREDNRTPLSSRLGTLPTAQKIAQLRDTDPGTLRRQLTGELDWITMRAMEKDRRHRYNSAAEFAGDVGHYLNNEPLIAGPPSQFYRIRKLVSKHRWPVASAAAVVAALCAGLVTSTLLYFSAEQSKLEAIRQTAEAEQQRALAEDRRLEADRQRALAESGWNAATGHAIANLDFADRAFRAAFSPDGQRVVTVSGDKMARVWNAATAQLIAKLEGHSGNVNSAAFSPDGQRVVTASGDGTARVWNAASAQLIVKLEGHSGDVNSAAFSPDGQRVVTASLDRTARVWNAVTGQVIAKLEGHTDNVTGAAFSPDGQRVVTVSRDGTARVWNGATGQVLAQLERRL